MLQGNGNIELCKVFKIKLGHALPLSFPVSCSLTLLSSPSFSLSPSHLSLSPCFTLSLSSTHFHSSAFITHYRFHSYTY